MTLDSVSWTAVVVAALRAIETHHPDSLVTDPYAEHFVRAAQGERKLPTRIEEVAGGDDDPIWGRGGRYLGLRTRAFDDYFRSAAAADVRQYVILGSGLDTRAYRLEWPADCPLFEVDQAHVQDFKSEVLASVGATPRVHLTRIGVDLRENWYEALLGAGFDPARPTAWLAEGLLLYLPADAETELIDIVGVASAPGSRIAYESTREEALVRSGSIIEETQAKTGMDFSALFHPDARPDSLGRLRGAGWHMKERSVFDFAAEYGRGPEPDVEDAIASLRWVLGTKSAIG
jgi:methyltransferase (TIGR00027 family)